MTQPDQAAEPAERECEQQGVGVPGRNLTREEARERACTITVHAYEVALDLAGSTDELFGSTSTVHFDCVRPGASTFLDLIAPRVHSVVLNGAELDAEEFFDGARVQLPGLRAGRNVVQVRAECAFSHTGEGLHRFTDPVDGRVYLYTQYEPADARRVFANFEQPDLKAAFSFIVTTPADWEVVGNSPTPAARPSPDGTVCRRFAPTPRISTYLTALVAGPYHAVRETYRGPYGEVPLGVFCRASLAPYLDAEEIFEITRQGLDLFQDRFGSAYPFAKYDQLFVPEYNIGAMENPGAVTFRENMVFRSRVTDAAHEGRATVLLHEMAHMWFGDLVTPRWWDDLWLKESFADFMGSYAAAETTRWQDAWTSFAAGRKDWAYRQDQLPTTHPVTAVVEDLEDAKLNFDGITYAKGAAVLKQLVAYVGEEAFFAGARAYFAQHAWGNTTLDHLLSALNEASGRELHSWSRLWLQTAGVNTLQPRVRTGPGALVTALEVHQQGSPLRPHRVAVGTYEHTEAGLVRTHRVEVDVTGEVTEVPELVGVPRPDLVLVNDDDLTYAKIRFDPRSWTSVRDSLGLVRGSLPRALCWAAAWDMTRDGELPARAYLDLVLRHAGTEADVGVLQKLHQQVATALDRYADPTFRPHGLRRLAAGAVQQVYAAEPGSGHQLAWTRALARSGRTGSELALLVALLDGTETIEGLAVDTEMRWALLRGLCAAGVVEPVCVDAELERDGTAAGQRHAAACRASLPTPAAKEEAWRLAVEVAGLSNEMLDSVLAGFATPGQEQLTAPFTPRYFEQVSRLWEERSIEIAQRLVVGLYPSAQVSRETLHTTDAWLASARPVPALERLVVECRDDVARALRARACDAAAGAARGE